MNPTTTIFVNKALSLIESTRYRMGVIEFCKAFIDNWAYQQTGLYPPASEMPEEIRPIAVELSNVLSKAIKADPTGDILGIILSGCGFDKRGTDYFPTPPELANLLAKLCGVDENNVSLYEPCCGSGSIAINWMENVLESKGKEALSAAEIFLEDIDPLMVKCSLLQILFYLEERGASLNTLSISTINVLSRKAMGVAYYATATTQTEQVA